jgi:hypothetical protein
MFRRRGADVGLLHLVMPDMDDRDGNGQSGDPEHEKHQGEIEHWLPTTPDYGRGDGEADRASYCGKPDRHCIGSGTGP